VAVTTGTITPKALSITADSNQKKVKGTSDPTFTYSSSGLVSGDSIVGSLSRDAGESVGTYNITQGTITDGNNPNYSITYTGATFLIYGPIAAADSATRTANSSDFKMLIADLLANDTRLDSNGVSQTSSLTLTVVTSGVGNTVELNDPYVVYEPSDASDGGDKTFTYTLTDGVTGATDTGTVTVHTGAATPFDMEILHAGTPTYDSGTDTSTVSVDLLGVPNTVYHIQYSTDLDATWRPTTGTPPGIAQNTGPSGSFTLTVTVAGNPTTYLFRATK
jgi:hypothetical protein